MVDVDNLVEEVASVEEFSSMDWFCCFNISYSQVMISLRFFFSLFMIPYADLCFMI